MIQSADIVVVGGGLCGLSIAEGLLRQDRDAVILEARSRWGGRMLSLEDGTGSGARYDMGAAWMWPHNHRMLSLAQSHGLSLEPQFATGNLVFQDAAGSVQRDLAFSTMGGSFRMTGGVAQLSETIAASLPPERALLEHRAVAIDVTADQMVVRCHSADGVVTWAANQVVLAMPPRVVAERIQFTPALEPADLEHLLNVPTWMASQAKVVAVYEAPFWRDAGFSGDAISHIGPLAEIHDVTDSSDWRGALFGFVHPRALAAGMTDAELCDASVEQLGVLFGENARTPVAVLSKMWGHDPLTAVSRDQNGSTSHPQYSPVATESGPFEGRLLLSGSETAPEHGGYLEGALEAAEVTLAQLRESHVGAARL
ncbi:MAG: FAD-dependent oxidoreductase [Pseudomonadota bacterium]